MIKRLRKYAGLIAGALSIILFLFFSWLPAVTERVYSTGIYLGFRVLWDYSVGLIPLPKGGIILLATAVVLFIRIRKRGIQWRGIRKFLLQFANGIGILLFIFFFAWGFNYARIPVTDALKLHPPKPDIAILTEEIARCENRILHFDAENIPAQESISATAWLRLRAGLHWLGYPVAGKPRTWQFLPDGMLYRLSCSGIYIPWFAEAYVEDGMHPTEIPFTTLHELAHAAGFADEGDANFIAWFAAMTSGDVLFQHSAELEFLEYLLSDLHRMDKAEWESTKNAINPAIISLLKERRACRDRHPALMPRFQKWMYNNYLKSVGVEEGIAAYNRLVGMVLGWRMRDVH